MSENVDGTGPADAPVWHLPPPWNFLWDKYGPRVVSSDGRIVASLSSGTINGPYDPAAVSALGKAIASNETLGCAVQRHKKTMDLLVVMGQRLARYEGEYGIEALAVMSEAEQSDNPQYLQDVLNRNKESGEFAAVSVLRLRVPESDVRAALFPEERIIEATVVT